MEETTNTTHTNDNYISPKSFEDAKKIIESIPKIKDDEVNALIATLGNYAGKQTFISKVLPKNMILIGTGDTTFDFLTKPPHDKQ